MVCQNLGNEEKQEVIHQSVIETFLLEEDGKVESVEMHCLKPKVGRGTVLEDTLDHLPDIGIFKIYKIIAGPLKVVPLLGSKMDKANYEAVYNLFRDVSDLNRLEINALM